MLSWPWMSMFNGLDDRRNISRDAATLNILALDMVNLLINEHKTGKQNIFMYIENGYFSEHPGVVVFVRL